MTKKKITTKNEVRYFYALKKDKCRVCYKRLDCKAVQSGVMFCRYYILDDDYEPKK